MNYVCIVYGGDLFVCVLMSGYWLLFVNDGKFVVEYAYAGSMFWMNLNLGGGYMYVVKGEEEFEEFFCDVCMLNLIMVVNYYSGYARFFEDSIIVDAWSKVGLF